MVEKYNLIKIMVIINNNTNSELFDNKKVIFKNCKYAYITLRLFI